MTKSNLQREICFIRANKTKYGGAEVYLSRLSDALEKENIKHRVINSIFPKFLPSWVRVILFNLQVCATKGHKFYFSLDRITCPDIYRAGDGVHKVFLTVERKSRLNPLHPIYLFLEKRCFRNAKRIIANSQMVREQIIETYDIDPNKIKVVRNGIETKEIHYQQSFEKLSKEFSITKGHPILLYVGSGFKRKGVKEFLQIIAKLEITNLKAFVIGKEKNIEYYHQLVKELDLESQVILLAQEKMLMIFIQSAIFFFFPLTTSHFLMSYWKQ
jgi:UDP-glucose:(heptosyl)LPS alpha-1,3-glucosyltransferase